MNRQEHLLVQSMEECNELAHRISKALRFGMDETQPNQPESNRVRIYAEYFDLRAVLGMAGFDAWDVSKRAQAAETAKVEKVRKYLEHARRCGTLQE